MLPFFQKTQDLLRLIASLALCLAAGAIGSLFTMAGMSGWYQSLQKPALNPPSWVFGPVWTALYIMMAVALFQVWGSGAPVAHKRRAGVFFAAQLLLNIVWSFFFFYWRSPSLAMADIILLWLSIAFTTAAFFRLSRQAGVLLLPYLLWVSFAAYLNFQIMQLNP